MLLDLTPGLTTTDKYKAFKFPGGEIHFKLSEVAMRMLEILPNDEHIFVHARINTAEQLLFLGIVLGTLNKDYGNPVDVYIPYMPYQQADRDFSEGECFSLLTIVKILDTYPRYSYTIFDPHSDVSPALLKLLGAAHVVDNSQYIKSVLNRLNTLKNTGAEEGDEHHWNYNQDLVILSPDAGAYKKIFKLCEKLGFTGRIECANKFRPVGGGEPLIRLSSDDFGGKDVLIIDDICVGGRTFVELAKLLRTKNAGRLHLAVSHGIFSQPLGSVNGLGSYFTTIFTTNSVRDSYKDVVESTNYLPNSMTQQLVFNVHTII
jgi:ribose-phosphate pyrophosphokinase